MPGWGKIEDQTLSEDLRYVDLSIVQCSGEARGKFCAKGVGQSTCQGDSGGGYVIRPNNIPLLIGVVSTSSSASITGCIPEAAKYNHFDSSDALFSKAKEFLDVGSALLGDSPKWTQTLMSQILISKAPVPGLVGVLDCLRLDMKIVCR